MENIRLALSQINCCVGDIEGNKNKIIDNIRKASDSGAHIVSFPELALTGYPPEDLLLKPSFIESNLEALDQIVSVTDSIIAIVGFVDRENDIYNAAAVIQNKKIVNVYKKMYLPNYGVFDENRYFQSGEEFSVFKFSDVIFGVSICEDIWYPGDPMRRQVISGNAQIIMNISSSPYSRHKPAKREQMIRTRASDYSTVVAFCNLVGGQDELVFDGNSVVVDERGEVISRAKGFEEDLLITDIDIEKIFQSRLSDPRVRKDKSEYGDENHLSVYQLDSSVIGNSSKKITPRVCDMFEDTEEIYRALVLGTRDYVLKNGFGKIVVGLSGGIDSSLVASIAVDALGNENVNAVSMPSQYSSEGSVTDAELLCRNLGINLISITIEGIFNSYIDSLADVFEGRKSDTTEENIQARIRGNLLMALSNKFGWLVLTTGNKSEMSVGYTTLYGDMAGGFAVIKDVPKTTVYELAKFINGHSNKEIIPNTVLDKPPSAELSPGQKDTNTLPEYHVLDRILKAYIEDHFSVHEIIKNGEDPELVKKIVRMVDLNEYKRRQSPPGIKITSRAFGKDRRFPITNRFRM